MKLMPGGSKTMSERSLSLLSLSLACPDCYASNIVAGKNEGRNEEKRMERVNRQSTGPAATGDGCVGRGIDRSSCVSPADDVHVLLLPEEKISPIMEQRDMALHQESVASLLMTLLTPNE
jgi:hypothetical protein